MLMNVVKTTIYEYTVNPPNSGHIGDRPFVRYSEVGRFSEGLLIEVLLYVVKYEECTKKQD